MFTKQVVIFFKLCNMNTNLLERNKVRDHNFQKFYLSKLVAKKGIEFYIIPVTNIIYFYCENRITYLKDLSGNKFIVEKPLVELESNLGKLQFLRIAKNILLNINQILKFKSLESGKIEVFTTDSSSIIVSQFYATNFRALFR